MFFSNIDRRFLLVHVVISAIILGSLFIFGCQSSADSTEKKITFPDSTTHYQIDAKISPDMGQFEAAIDMQFMAERSRDTLRFLLHDAFKLEELTGPAVGNYSTRPWHFGGEDTVHTKVVSISLSNTVAPSEQVLISWNTPGAFQMSKFPILAEL